VPAAAVIPAPIAYIKVAAVKKLVVGSQPRAGGPAIGGQPSRPGPRIRNRALPRAHFAGRVGSSRCVYFEKIGVLTAGAQPEQSCME
jgi:hypothetical protein